MKIVIIGGGVAGLAFGIMMTKKGHQVIINEKQHQIPTMGNAFMMHDDGLSVLKRILDNKCDVPGSLVDTFILKRPDNTDVKHTKMEAWQCVKRSDLINALLNVTDKKTIKYNRAFSHFIYENGKAFAVVFENGDVEFGDFFVGADGCNSQVRQLIFGETNFTKPEVQEILGIVKGEDIIKKLNGVFTKYQDAKKGISFGCIPFSNNEAIWFNQFDISLTTKKLTSKKDFYDFTKNILKDFPEIVHTIIDSTDFSETYLWNTKDFDALPSFHSKNIVLIGDAAHLALPFTSAGTTNALYDAEELANCLDENNNLTVAFTNFYLSRIESIKEHITLGRKLKFNFLHPDLITDDDIEIPLIKHSVINNNSRKIDTQFEILYFTDPICSTCWSIQPQLRKLKMDYPNNLNIKYMMGGLLPSWKNFDRGGIKKPEDVVGHWKDVYLQSGMPIDGSIWIEEPPDSSYPPSIAFKAAQLQDIDKAIIFLRRMNEIVFLENKNIARVDVIIKAAYDAGLDVARLLRDVNNKALNLFYKDLNYAKSLEIDILPTFVFKVSGEIKDYLYGAQTYEIFEETMLKYQPKVLRSIPPKSPADVFKQFPTLTKPEFKFLNNIDDDAADKMINNMLQVGIIKQLYTKAGFIFYANAV